LETLQQDIERYGAR